MDWNEILEELSALEHEQWEHWSKTIIDQTLGAQKTPFDHLSVSKAIHEKHQRWLAFWKPYDELSEEIKEYDRIWARKVLKIIAKHIGEEFEEKKSEVNKEK